MSAQLERDAGPRYGDGTAVQLGDVVNVGTGRGRWKVEAVTWNDYTHRGGMAWWSASVVTDTGKRPYRQGASVANLRPVERAEVPA